MINQQLFRLITKVSAMRPLTISMSSSLLGLLFMTMGAATQADTLDLSLSDSAARGEFQTSFKPSRTYRSSNRQQRKRELQRRKQLEALNYGFNLLYRDDDVYVGGATLHVTGRTKATVLKQHTGIGGKFVAFDAGDPSGSALAVGGYLIHNLAAANLLSVRGDIYYAPGVVTFGDGQRYLEFGVRLEYKLVEQASVYLGYRNIDVHFDQSDFDLDKSGHLGLIMHF